MQRIHVLALDWCQRYFPAKVAPCAMVPAFQSFCFRRAVRAEDTAFIRIAALVERLDSQLPVFIVVIQHRCGAAERTRKSITRLDEKAVTGGA
jgi:hypothetical protein